MGKLKVTLWLLCLVPCLLMGQLDRKARKQFEKYEELKPRAMELLRYDTLVAMASEIYELEAKCEKQDSSFLARISAEIGMLYGKKEWDWNAAQAHYRSAEIYEKRGNKLEAGVQISLYLYHNYWAKQSALEDPNKVLDSNIYRFRNDTVVYKSLRARDMVRSPRRDTLYIELYGGIDQGVEAGAYIDLRSTFDTFYAYDREIVALGEGHITEVFPYYSKGWIAMDSAYLHMVAYARDAFQVRVRRQKKAFGTPMAGLARHNIQIKSFWGTGYFIDGGASLDLDVARWQPCIKLAMIEDLKGVVQYYDTAEAAIIATVVESGPFKGQTWRDALLKVSDFDLDQWMAYDYAYPARDINRTFSIAAKYVGWVNAGSGLGHTEDQIVAKLMEIPKADLLSNGLYWGGYYHNVDNIDSLIDAEITSPARGLDDFEQIAAYERFQTLSRIAGNASSDSFYSYKLLWKYSGAKLYKQAIEAGTKIWPITKGWHKSWTAIGIAQAYSSLDQDHKAVEYLDSALELDPQNMYCIGIKGWYLTKLGRFRDAYPLTKAAFEDDSTLRWRVINYGHSLFIAGETAAAENMYNKSLGMITRSSEFYTGLIDDYNIFIRTGLMENQFRELKARYVKIFKDKYEKDFEADSVFQLGKDLHNNKKDYLGAEEQLKLALKLQYEKSTPNFLTIRSVYRWIGYVHYKNKNYNLALSEGYLKAMRLTEDKDLGADNLISDYEDVGNIYEWLEDDGMMKEYESRQANVETILREQRDKKSLYAVVIGNSGKGKNDEYAEADATQFSKDLEDAALLHFDDYKIINLLGKNATQNEVVNALDSVIYNSGENDIFVFYVAGNAQLTDSTAAIELADGDYPMEELVNVLQDVPAGRQLHIADCNGLDWRDFYNKENFTAMNSEKMSLMFFGYSDVRIEESKVGHSVLADALHRSFEKSLSDGMATASEWFSNSSAELFKADHLYAFEYQSYGHDFVIGRKQVDMGEGDTSKPLIELFGAIEKKQMRGGETVTIVNGSSERSGKISDQSKIILATANGIPLKVSANGRFDLPRELRDTNMITIEAIDAIGLRGISVFQYQQNDKATSNESARYAFLFASEEYANWNKLHNPKFDAKEIGRILEVHYGFKVEVIYDPVLAEVKSKLLAIRKTNFKRQDQVFVFFAGHGLFDSTDGGGYYVCVDSKASVDDGFHDSYLSQGKVIELLNLTSCNNVFLAMDVCFGGKIFDKYEKHEYVNVGDGNDITPDAFIARQLNISCRQFLTSGGNNYVADGVPGSHSPFASRFIRALEDGATNKKYTTASDIMEYLRMMKTLGNDKRSFPRYGSFGGDKDGEFVFKVIVPKSKNRDRELANL